MYHPYRKRKPSSATHLDNSPNKTPHLQVSHSDDDDISAYETKLGLRQPSSKLRGTSASQYPSAEFDMDQAKRIIKRLKSRQNPTPDYSTGVNYEYMKSNQIPVERLRFHGRKARKRRVTSASTTDREHALSQKRSHSALSFYTSGTLNGEYSIMDDDISFVGSGIRDYHDDEEFNGGNYNDGNDATEEDEYLNLTRSLLKDTDSLSRVSRRITSASSVNKRRRHHRGNSPSKFSPSAGMSPVSRILPNDTKRHLVQERRKLKSALSSAACSSIKQEGQSTSFSIAPHEHIHQSFQKMVTDIESEIIQSKKAIVSKKHGFRRHFKNSDFDSHNVQAKRLNKRLYEAARQQEKRDRMEKDTIAFMKAKRRRERQRKSFKMQQQKNFLKRVRSQEPRVLEQVADVLNPIQDEDVVVTAGLAAQEYPLSSFSSPMMSKSRSAPTTRPQSSSGSYRRVHRYPGGVASRSQTPDVSFSRLRSPSRPQSGSSTGRSRSRPRSRLQSALQKASSGFEYEEGVSLRKDLKEMDRLDRRLQQEGRY